ncbi:unnamed protein product, partial [Nesidiocoris tenuis]
MWDLTAYGGSVSHRVNFTIEFLTNDADCNGCAVDEGYSRGFKRLGSHDHSILIHQLYCRLLQLLFFDFQIGPLPSTNILSELKDSLESTIAMLALRLGPLRDDLSQKLPRDVSTRLQSPRHHTVAKCESSSADLQALKPWITNLDSSGKVEIPTCLTLERMLFQPPLSMTSIYSSLPETLGIVEILCKKTEFRAT